MHRPDHFKNVAVALSGGGRSLANLLAHVRDGKASYKICAVVSSRPDCGGVEIAKEAGLPLFIGDFSKERNADTGEKLYKWLGEQGAYWFALAGFLKPLPISPQWQQRVINIHPALLPKFGGLGMYGHKVHAAVLSKAEKESGASIHFVNEHYDEGQIIAQARVPVKASDNVDSLAKRVFQAECKLYPRVLDDLTAMKLPLDNKKIKTYEL